jgi:hypothetical protein
VGIDGQAWCRLWEDESLDDLKTLFSNLWIDWNFQRCLMRDFVTLILVVLEGKFELGGLVVTLGAAE